MNIAIIGTGYVGLVTACCFAKAGHEVVGVDIDAKIIENLNHAKISIVEPGLEELIKEGLNKGKLKFTSDTEMAIRTSDIIFIAVSTLIGPDNNVILDSLYSVIEIILNSTTNKKKIVIKSTVPIGTANNVLELVKQKNKLNQISIISNPEFLKEGSAIQDFIKPDRIVIGINNESDRPYLENLFSPFTKTENPIFFTDHKAAEMIKYVANAYLATKISFINEMALLAGKCGADINEVKKGISMDPRIGPDFLNPGIGYGGSCLPKDIKALIYQAKTKGLEMPILTATEAVNNNQISLFFDMINKRFIGKKNLRFAVWGLSFKPNTNDIREAPSIKIIKKLIYDGIELSVYDPMVKKEQISMLKDNINFSDEKYKTLNQADALIVFTDWDSFKNVDYEKMSQLMNQKIIFDGRNIFEHSQLKKFGFEYYCFGRENLI